jgi:hypothetical protein
MVEGLNFSDSRMDNVRSLYNAAPRLIGARVRLAPGLRASQGFLPSLHCLRGARGKQPYVIAMKDGSPFGLAGLWKNWRKPKTGRWESSFAIITVPSNDLPGQI